jgi:hypothetical protein
MTEKKSLQAGVLIIGSLYWDDRRQTWRNSRLTHDVYDVPVRIRYGRCSEKRGDSYTMVFSQQAEEGRAKIVRCRHAISKPAHLIEEAEHLWAAESLNAKGEDISAKWGCVTLLCNPAIQIPADIGMEWSKHVAGRTDYKHFKHAAGEKPSVTEHGHLQIPWPVFAVPQGAEPLDLVIATANQPTITNGAYASVEAIAHPWSGRDNKYVEYFRKNRASGITTFEDDAIARLLEGYGSKTL